MLSKILSCQRAHENMYVNGSQPIVHFRRALTKGIFGKKKGIPSACDRLRPPATVSTPMSILLTQNT